MFEWRYLIWALLPIALFWQMVSASGKKVLKFKHRDDVSTYASPFGFTMFVFVASILVDRYLFESFARIPLDMGVPPQILHWLLFPFLLLCTSILQQQVLDKKNKEEDDRKKARRMKGRAEAVAEMP